MDSDTDMASSSTGRPHAPRSSKPGQRRLSRARNLTLTSSPEGIHGSTAIRPPTPAPSPTPNQRAPDWSTAAEDEDSQIKHTRARFREMNRAERLRLMGELLNLCDSHELSFVADFVSPRLKKDPFMVLPTELCLRILECVEHPTTLVRASQVSRRWRELVNDDTAWRLLCQKYSYRNLSKAERAGEHHHQDAHRAASEATSSSSAAGYTGYVSTARWLQYPDRACLQHPGVPVSPSGPESLRTQSLDRGAKRKLSGRRPKATTYRSHFKQRYMVETAWRVGGQKEDCTITPDQGVVTSLHLTNKYIVVALDNAKIHVFDVNGKNQKTLQGHVMGVWAMVPWRDLLVSGGCDRDVRVWNLATGCEKFTLRGHTSTVRCLKMSDSNTAISGSRDTTLRIWDLEKGLCKHVLIGHQASVRCLEIHGDIVVSGSYDTTAKIWSISEGKCLRTLTGHFSQIYAIAFDGKKIATGSLDTSVRIWDPTDGRCLHVLQGHTSLVGQLQMRDDILVTGGSDGSVRVWSLIDYQAIHRLAAHDNSVTSLQFDQSRIVSGGSDGRVKVWDLKKGTLVRELSTPAETVWRVVFEEEKCVIMASRNGRTVMEVWSFSPPDDDEEEECQPTPIMFDHSFVEDRRSEEQRSGERRRPKSAMLPITSPGEDDVAMTDVGGDITRELSR